MNLVTLTTAAVVASCVLSLPVMSQDRAAADLVAKPKTSVKLTCKNVKNTRWQVCGDFKPMKKFVIGVGIRFAKIDPSGQFRMVGDSHTDCASLRSERAVPVEVRKAAATMCQEGDAPAHSQRLMTPPLTHPPRP